MFETPVFIDIEASSLAADSWPIEVGVAWLEGKRVIKHSSLIQPKPEWPEAAWHVDSAKIHNIPREDLNNAPLADDVAVWLAELVDGRPLVSDAPAFDERWLRQITGDQEWCKVYPLQEALWWAFSDEGKINPGKLRRAYKHRVSQKTVHRAADDAAAHAYAWRNAMR
tara:strand:- start:11329 stop:11832 length:504 start_codon:yes stop_codon:yes gene_type:complete